MSTVIGTNSRGGIAKSAKNASSKASNRTGVKTSTASSTPTNNSNQLSSLQSQLSSKIQEAKNVGLNTTKAESFLSSSYAQSSGGSDILTSENTKPATTVTLPKMGTLPSLSDIIDINNANLGGSTYNTSTKQFDMTQSGQTQPQNQLSALAQYLNSNQQEVDNTQSNETRLEQNRKLFEEQQKKVNSLQAQVNTIISNRDDAILALEGQGRGQTSGFIGGEQARIYREAARQALPIQTQLAVAQDDLDSARTYASQLFQAQSQDAQAKLQYQKEVNATIYQYLTDEQKRIATANEKKADREYATIQDNRAMLEKLVLTAIDNGQASKIGKITTIDPAAKTFLQEYASAASTINKNIATATKSEPKNFGTADNPNWLQQDATGTWVPVPGVSTPTNTQAIGQTQNQLDFMLKTAKNVDGLAGASGRSGVRRWVEGGVVGATDFTNLVAETNTLRTNMLTLATDPTIKKFFGPQMSNADVQLMTSAGTTLNPELQSPAKLKEENMRITDFIERAKLSTLGVTQFGKTDGGVRVGVTPEGIIVDAYGNEYTEEGRPVNESKRETRGFFDDFLSAFGL